jgi:carbon monoxide dehydrogenase subunit G
MSMLTLSVSLVQAQSAQNTQTQKTQPKVTTKANNKAESPKQTVIKAPTDAELAAHELQIAEKVHVGHLPCELGASVRLEPDASQPGYFYLHGKGFRYRMHPVVTTTGAIRLEDRKAGAVWLQLANKSMLMSQKLGRRLADECRSPLQAQVAQAMLVNPPPSVLDAVPKVATPTATASD